MGRRERAEVLQELDRLKHDVQSCGTVTALVALWGPPDDDLHVDEELRGALDRNAERIQEKYGTVPKRFVRQLTWRGLVQGSQVMVQVGEDGRLFCFGSVTDD